MFFIGTKTESAIKPAKLNPKNVRNTLDTSIGVPV